MNRRDRRKARQARQAGNPGKAGRFARAQEAWERGDRERMWIDDRPVSYDEIMAETQRVGHDVDDEGRVLFADDPAVGLGSIATGMTESGQLVTDEITDQMPVAMFEPRRAMMTQDTRTGRVDEGQVAAAVQLGLQRFTRPAVALTVAEGWVLRRRPAGITGGAGGLELVDPGGSVFSRSSCVVPPEWTSAVVSARYALVVYGTRIGVRTPPNMSAAAYSAQARAAELKESRTAGIVAAGIVAWA